MEGKNNYVILENLEVYKFSREYSRLGWVVYAALDWQQKKIMGDQMIESTDSVGANIAEGYGRYHYLDKIKFYYNGRGSLLESKHWIELLNERNLLSGELLKKMIDCYKQIEIKLNLLIKSQLDRKYNH